MTDQRFSEHERGAQAADAFWGAELDRFCQVIARLIAVAPPSAAVENAAMLLAEFDFRYCRECGCSEQDACESGCAWVADDLCSACARTK